MTDESASIPKTVDGQSNSSREENNSSGYVSETSNDTKNEEKPELKTSEITVNVDDKNKQNKDIVDVKTEVSTDENKENLNVVKDENKTVKQSPVPKPPRLGTLTATRLDPQAYINIEIEPTDTKTSGMTKTESDEKADAKQDLVENEKANTETKIENTQPKTELKNTTHEDTNQHKTRSVENVNNDNVDKSTNKLEKHTTSTLPKLPQSDKRRAPEPPDGAKNTKKISEKSSKKGECNLNFLTETYCKSKSFQRHYVLLVNVFCHLIIVFSILSKQIPKLRKFQW